MKKGFIIAFLFLSSVCKGQQEIDDIVLCCFYKTIQTTDTVENRFTEDLMRLEVGRVASSFYSDRLALRDSLRKERLKNGQAGNTQGMPKGVSTYRVYQNYPKGKLSFFNSLVGKHNNFYYESDFVGQKWKIGTERKEVMGYTCQQATCTYSGREYIAWFSSEIPIPKGPHVFHGLPGLILEVADTKGHYRFEAVGLEKAGITGKIVYKNKDYVKIPRKDYLKIEREFIADPISFVNQYSGVKISGLSTDKERKESGFKMDAYLPLELED